MKALVELFERLDQSNKTNDKIKALIKCLEVSPSEDLIWVIGLFSGRKPKKAINSTLLRTWAAEEAGISNWIFEECYHIVGDLAETIAHLLPNKNNRETSLSLSAVLNELTTWSTFDEEYRKDALLKYWRTLPKEDCFVFNKFLTGGFRVGVSQSLLVKALAKFTQKPEAEIQHRLMGNWHPSSTTIEELLYQKDTGVDLSKLYPFCLAYPIEAEVCTLGRVGDWQIEWKWDGIRCQLIKRSGQVFLWSRGEELITDRFPEIVEAAQSLGDNIVLDGELVAYQNGQVQPFGTLQTRITRKNVSKKMLLENPAAMLVYDLLEWRGEDIRSRSLKERVSLLNSIEFNQEAIIQPNLPQYSTWKEVAKVRDQSREFHAEGLMLKAKESAYHSGRKRGDWWKWKLDPYTIDAVLVYAQKGHGRRADLFTDYTFAVWHNKQLVTFTKAYSGLTDKELVEVDRFVKKNTLEKFGPVRTVTPALVFEIGFEGIQSSSRHKSGIALRFPRILRWRKDKKIEEANALEDLQKLLQVVS